MLRLANHRPFIVPEGHKRLDEVRAEPGEMRDSLDSAEVSRRHRQPQMTIREGRHFPKKSTGLHSRPARAGPSLDINPKREGD
jgi:hypothetical protein